MLSRKRLAYVLLIVLGICAMFILYNFNESRNQIVSISNNVFAEQELISGQVIDKKDEICFYVVGNEEKEIYKDIHQNVCQMLDDIGVQWNKTDRIEEKELSNVQAVFVFCDDNLNTYVDLQKLAAFVENGGKIILAAGLAEGYEDSYFSPVIGILEKTTKDIYQDFCFKEAFFPLQDEKMKYDGLNYSTWINVRKDATVYIEESEKSVPIVYEYPFGKGKSLVINGTILSDCRNVGILTSGISCLLEEFIYPIVGVECVFLDNFPIATYVSNALSLKLYGRTTEAFVLDVVWPVFSGMALRNDIKYTSSILTVASDKDAFPVIADDLFNTLGKSALQYNGEMAYAAYCEDVFTICCNDKFINNFKKIFRNYKISSLVMMSEEPIQDAMDMLGQEIKVVRGKLESDKKENRMDITSNYTVFPEATNGIDLNQGEMLSIASVYAGYGMISHTFDINQLIATESNNSTWDTNKKQITDFEKRVFSKVKHLNKVSLSEVRDVLKSYLGMEYTWKKKENTLELYANNIIPGQPFMFRTEGKILDAQGAEYESLGNNYYLIRMNQSRVILSIQEGK